MFHDDLRQKMDTYVHSVYALTRKFPREELFGSTSQLRRAALSVILNYIEGYARQREAVYKNFLQIAFGSLKESHYLIVFSIDEGFISRDDARDVLKIADEMGAMLWKTLQSFK